MNIDEMLAKEGPLLSSRLVERLIQKGLTRVAARKRVSRIGGDIRKLRGIRFPNRESFLFLKDQWGGERFIANLASVFKETRSCYGRAIFGLEARGGVVPTLHFPVASGLSVANAKGQVPHGYVEKKLFELGLVRREATKDGELVVLQNITTSVSHQKATMVVENIVLGAIKSWIGRVGMASCKATKTRGEDLPQFGQFRWDIVGPTYLTGMVSYRSDKLINGFIVGDIILGKNITLSDLTPFLSKCDILTHQKRKTRFQPMFIAASFSSDALGELRRRGHFIARPATLFGEEIAELLRRLVQTIENAAAALINDPTGVFKIIGKLEKLEGAALNLRGVVLEFIIARLYVLKGYTIDIRRQITLDGERAEIDIKAVNRQEVVCIECKGNASGNLVDRGEIEKWMKTPVVRIKKWLDSVDSLPPQRRFVFYTATDFTEDAKSLICEIERSHVKQPIVFLNGKNILKELRSQNESALVNIFTEQFANHSVEGKK